MAVWVVPGSVPSCVLIWLTASPPSRCWSISSKDMGASWKGMDDDTPKIGPRLSSRHARPSRARDSSSRPPPSLFSTGGAAIKAAEFGGVADRELPERRGRRWRSC